MKTIKKIYHYYAPLWLKRMYRKIVLKNDIDKNLIAPTGAEKELQYVKKIGLLEAIPYDWTSEYHARDYKIQKDESGYFCILQGNKKIYFPVEDCLDASASEMIAALMVEQDRRSPHQYFSNNVNIQEGDIFFDIGAAEGLITLLNIEKIKKAYLFECDPKWIDALQKTFAPYKEKIEIINKYVGGAEDATHVTLHSFLQCHNKDQIFIKMDIEGMEMEVVTDGIDWERNYKNLKFTCCTYHRITDANDLKKLFESKGYETEFSEGYMAWGEEPPYFRKGIIRAWKSDTVR